MEICKRARVAFICNPDQARGHLAIGGSRERPSMASLIWVLGTVSRLLHVRVPHVLDDLLHAT